MEKIRVKYLRDVEPIKAINKGDWIDLYCAETVDLREGDRGMIPLGVAMQLPAGYEAHLVPRSSTFRNYGIIQTNSIGIIDNSYCGDNDEWMMPVYATRDMVIRKGVRICQFRIVENMPEVEIEEVESLGNADRGGFGSTGA